MEVEGYLCREKRVVWRDIAGEVVILEEDGATVHMLNKTASLIWSLADGTRRPDDISRELCQRFEVTPSQAQSETEQFCRQLTEAGLAILSPVRPGV